jgi:hypothetical protein
MADATTLTQAGYVGDDVESIIYKLLQVGGLAACTSCARAWVCACVCALRVFSVSEHTW